MGHQFHRLDPPILGPPNLPPTLIATCLARFDFWRNYIIEQIYTATNTSEAARSLTAAGKFVSEYTFSTEKEDIKKADRIKKENLKKAAIEDKLKGGLP